MGKRNLLTAAQLGIDDVLETVKDIFGLVITQRGDEAHFLCPVHEDHSPSASVNLKTGYWNCWSCGAGGDIINLGTKATGQSRMILELSLSPTDPLARRTAILTACRARKTVQSPTEVEEVVIDRIHDPEEFTLEPMDYMRGRGFKDHILRFFGIRYGAIIPVRTRKNKLMRLQKTICIPIHDQDGDLKSWCFRATEGSPEYQPRYFYTTGSPGKELLFGEDRISSRETSVVVTEGAIDAMWCWQAGFPAVAVLGASNLGTAKVDRLSDFRTVTIFGDNNRAGAEFASRLGSLLLPHTSVRICRYRRSWPGTDPNTLSTVQVSDAIERAIPYHLWRDRQAN